jgi:hypothetical protein
VEGSSSSLTTRVLSLRLVDGRHHRGSLPAAGGQIATRCRGVAAAVLAWPVRQRFRSGALEHFLGSVTGLPVAVNTRLIGGWHDSRGV